MLLLLFCITSYAWPRRNSSCQKIYTSLPQVCDFWTAWEKHVQIFFCFVSIVNLLCIKWFLQVFITLSFHVFFSMWCVLYLVELILQSFWNLYARQYITRDPERCFFNGVLASFPGKWKQKVTDEHENVFTCILRTNEHIFTFKSRAVFVFLGTVLQYKTLTVNMHYEEWDCPCFTFSSGLSVTLFNWMFEFMYFIWIFSPPFWIFQPATEIYCAVIQKVN